MAAVLPELQTHYQQLTPAEKKLADFVLRYPSQTVTLSAAALARQAGTDP